MTSAKDVRDSFRSFFERHGHTRLPSGPIVPANDPTLMFANAGMVQFKDALLGKEKRGYTRATTAQKCVRVSGKHNDLENVGVTARHQTFFEMLGNFSFGDYFKREAIELAWGYLHGVLDLPKERLCVTVFAGEDGLPRDDEAMGHWKKIAGFADDRIVPLGADDNFWRMGDTGPCGPCSEIYYCLGKGEPDVRLLGQEAGADGTGWVEIWNLVFMQFERSEDGTLSPLPKPSIDTGFGLERACCATQGVVSNYDTDLLRPIVERAGELAGKQYRASPSEDDVSMRVIADHARTTAFLIAEGVFPDRDGRAYVLRRVMRRAIRHGHRLGIEQPFLHQCASLVAERMGDEYPELRERKALIEQITVQEEERFRATLKRGLERIASATFAKAASGRVLPGETAFELYDTYGFPLDLQEVIGREQGFAIDEAGFQAALERARERSAGSKVGEAAVAAVYVALARELPAVTFLGYEQEQAEGTVLALVRAGARVKALSAGEEGSVVASATPFYAESGGQVGDRGVIAAHGARFAVTATERPRDGLVVHHGKLEQGALSEGASVKLDVDHAARAATRRNHSATHLLHLALRAVVGPHAMQKGSLVGPDRLRFDYSAAQALTAEQIARIEDMVNERILGNAAITTDVLPMDEAKRRGAIGIFEEKYGDVVRMLTIADSKELCGGTHAARTGDIGAFKILSDGGIAAGVRRIEAATGMNVLLELRKLERELSTAAELLKGSPRDVVVKLEKLLERGKEQQRELELLKKKLVSGGGARDLTASARQVGAARVLSVEVEIADPKALRELADQLRDKLAPAVIVLGARTDDGRALLACTVSKELNTKVKAGDLIKELAKVVGGNGGGRPDFAQAGGNDPAKLGDALDSVHERVAALSA